MDAAARTLTLRERAAETIMAGLAGTAADDGALRSVTADAGCVVLLDHNVTDRAQLRALVAALRAAAPRRLLVAVDEEGGRVARLGNKGLVAPVPSARALAHNCAPDEVRRIARRLARELRDAGIDWNLAPVLDVTDADDGSVIGDRAYGDAAETVARYGTAFAAGLREGGVLTAGKHFPGHGRTIVDSHLDGPVLDVTPAQLAAHDLVPFRRALPFLDAVLSSHVVYPRLDPHRPASLSCAATRLLREEFGYDGLLVTDSLSMAAVADRWSGPEAAVLALQAGADVAMVCDPDQVTAAAEAVAAAVADERLPARRLDEAVERVLRAKGYDDQAVSALLAPPPAPAGP